MTGPSITATGLLFALAAASAASVAPSPQSQPATASIAGRVLESTSPDTPARRAFITITGAGLPSPRGAVTDDSGAFIVSGLPAGRFVVTASKPAHLTSAYGAKAPGRPGMPISLAAGAAVANLAIVMPRGAVITGVVRDQTGEPAPGVSVAAALARTISRAPGRADTTFTTDDLGRYRIYGLEPGEYVVAAVPKVGTGGEAAVRREQEVDAILADLKRGSLGALPPVNASGLTGVPAYDRAMQAPRAYVPIFYPSAWNVTAASRVAVATGETKDGIDIQLQLVRTVAVRGTLTGAADANPSALVVSLTTESVPLPLLFGVGPSGGAVRPDGSFEITNVTPGTYLVRAQMSPGGGRGGPSAPRQFAQLDLVVGESDVNAVALALQPAMTLTGRVAFEGTTTPPSDLTVLRVSLESAGGGLPLLAGMPSVVSNPPVTVAVSADATFTLPGLLPDTYRLSTSVSGGGEAPKGWWLRSARLGDRDLLDDGALVAPGADISGVVVTFSDRHTELSGVLQTAAGAPATDYFVIACTTNRAWWRPGARRVQLIRPANDGRFVFADLPPGDYLLAALSDVAGDEWRQPAFLGQFEGASVKVTIGEGEKKVQDLRIGR